MSDNTLALINLSRVIFIVANILLDYSFLKSKRPLWFQITVITGTWGMTYLLRELLSPIINDAFWLNYMLNLLYLIPFVLIFKETLHAKVFIFFMVFSLSQCNFLILLYLEVLLFGKVIGGLLVIGMLLELLCVPLIKKYLQVHVRNILDVIEQQNPSFTIFPILSFLMLAFYRTQINYSLATFIPLVLNVLLIGFSYYLIALSIYQTKRHQQLELTSRTDSLTGLYNRLHMEHCIHEEYEQYQRTGTEFALIIVDVDFFKKINDTYGHDAGDCVLKLVSEDLRKTVRESDRVARWGGDEFLLLLPKTNGENAVGIAEKINKLVGNRKYDYGNETLAVTLTLGVAVIMSGDTVASIIRKADLVMYQGKRKSRNCVISFDSTDLTELDREL